MTEVYVGSRVVVRESDWVRIQNPDEISRRHDVAVFNRHLRIHEKGGTLTVVGVQGSRVLVRYQNEDSGAVGPAAAPSGALFYVKADDDLQDYQVETDFIENLQKVPWWKSMLLYYYAYLTVRVGSTAKVPTDEWIKIQNPQGNANKNWHFKCGDNAVILEGGTLCVEKRTSSTVFVRYQHEHVEKLAGTSAGNGAQFSLPLRQFSQMTAVYEQMQSRFNQEKEQIRSYLRCEAA